MAEKNPFEEANELTAIQCVEQASALFRSAGMMLGVVTKNPPKIYSSIMGKMNPLATSLIRQADDFAEFATAMKEIRELHRGAKP